MCILTSEKDVIMPFKDEIILIAVARNEITRMPSFLEHYRLLGVNKFLIVDNGSTDGTSDFLLDQPDVCLFRTTQSYGKSGCGHDWIRELLAFCIGNWCVVADCDEYFIYPQWQTTSLKDLSKKLACEGATAISSYLLDMYSEYALASNRLPSGAHPLEICSYFDSIPIDNPSFQNPLRGIYPFNYSGGMRRRTFGINACLNKISFFKNLKGTNLWQGAHYIDGASLSKLRCATLHFKYVQGFSEYVASEASRQEHFNNGSEYKAYAHELEKQPDINAFCNSSIKLGDFNDFFENELTSDKSRFGPKKNRNSGLFERLTGLPVEICLKKSITHSNHLTLSRCPPEGIIQWILKNKGNKEKSVVIIASRNRADMWRDLAAQHGQTTIFIDANSDLPISSMSEYPLLKELSRPLVILEAVSEEYGRLHFVDLIVSELNSIFSEKATYYVDISTAVFYHQFDHQSSSVDYFFGSLPASEFHNTPTNFISCGNQAHGSSGATSTDLVNCYSDLSARMALIANIVRATLLEWGAEIIERFKVVNSLTAFRIPNGYHAGIPQNSKLLLYHVDSKIMTLDHRHINFDSPITSLIALAKIIGIADPTFHAAARVSGCPAFQEVFGLASDVPDLRQSVELLASS